MPRQLSPEEIARELQRICEILDKVGASERRPFALQKLGGVVKLPAGFPPLKRFLMDHDPDIVRVQRHPERQLDYFAWAQPGWAARVAALTAPADEEHDETESIMSGVGNEGLEETERTFQVLRRDLVPYRKRNAK
jgi:hypothetical protein